MRISRLAALGTVLALLAALFSVGSASAATPGVGTAQATTSLVQLELGDLLAVDVLTDASRSTLDKAVATVPEAATALFPLTLASGTVDALNQQIAPTEVRTTGAEKKTDYSADLGALVPALVDGTLTPATLSALVDATGAKAGLLNNLADLSLGGGLATVDAVAADLATLATKDASTANRTLTVDTISGLNLGALLAGLGIPVADLDLANIESLVEDLGLLGASNPVGALLTSLGLPASAATGTELDGVITGLQDTIANATAGLADLNDTGIVPVCDDVAPLGALFALIPELASFGVVATDTCQDAVATLTSALDANNLDLGGLLGGLLDLVDGMELLNVDGIDVGVASKATDAVDTSSAKVTAAIGTINIANLADIPGTDVIAAVTAVQTQLNDILDAIDPGLLDMIDLKLLDTTGTGVSKDNAGYVRSVANLTALDLSITPPADLTDIVAGLGLDGVGSIGNLLGAVPGATVPVLEGTAAADTLGTLLGGTGSPVDALVSGARLRIASTSAAASFLPAAAPGTTTPGGTLPRTGGSTAGFAVVGVIMAMLGLSVRRRVLAPVRVD